MKLAISNIAWRAEDDNQVYELLRKYDYTGLEIAPTRIIPNAPYDNVGCAVKWKEDLQEEQGFVIPSMQSIWYGREENIFGTDEERSNLKEYMKKAILFAEAMECSNLVMGCPKNRRVPDGLNALQIAIPFFRELGEFAAEHNTVIGLEANPTIYNTNFINNTSAAIDLIKEVDSSGFQLNLDVGTMIHNGEKVDVIKNYVDYISHVHISEPRLAEIQNRELHYELRELLEEMHYIGYISIEMGGGNNIKDVMEYVNRVFC